MLATVGRPLNFSFTGAGKVTKSGYGIDFRVDGHPFQVEHDRSDHLCSMAPYDWPIAVG